MLKQGDFGMSKDADISFWLDYRAHKNMPPLTEVCDFVIMDDVLFDEFEKFRDWDRGDSWIPYNRLVRCWKETSCKINVSSTTKFGREYIKLTNTEVDNLCQWIKDTRTNLQNRKEEPSVPCVCQCTSGCHTRCRCRKMGQHCLRFCHKGKECNNSEREPQVPANPVTVPELSPPSKRRKHQDQWLCIEGSVLTVEDYNIIKNGEWLNDKHINVAQALLLKQFPNLQGLQSCNFAQTLTFDIVSSNSIHIINIFQNHWITISTIGCDIDQVNICDSLHSHMH